MGRACKEHRLKIALVSKVIVMRRLVTLLCVGLVASLAGWAVPALAGANPVEITLGSGSAQDISLSTTLSPAISPMTDTSAASVSIEVVGTPTQDVPLTVRVSGETEVARRLYVFVGRGSGCYSAPQEELDIERENTSLTPHPVSGESGEALSAGSYSKEYSYTPTQASSYIVCGYVDDASSDTPDATSTTSFTAEMPAASVSIEVVGSPTQDVPLTVRVSGETEVARRLYVFVNANYGCYGTQGDELDGASTNEDGITSLTPKPVSGESGEALSAGSYSKEYSYTPPEASSPATYTLCGYIAEGEYGYDAPDATGTASFTYISPEAKAAEEKRVAAAKAEEEKRKAEEEKRVAEKKATEEERAAPAKAEEERHAKEKYEEEAPEREAAEEEKRVAAAEAQAHKTPVKHLSVKAVLHSRHFSADPGYTNLDVTTSPYAYVVVKLMRYGHSTESFEWGAHSTEVAEVIRWSCKSPGGIYRYVVTAKSDVGRTLKRRGSFVPVSIKRCRALKKQEAEARERRERENREARKRSEREANEERAGVERAERQWREEYEFNCRQLGGTPVPIFVEGIERIDCRGPYGGEIHVP